MLFEQGVSQEADSLNDQWDTWKTTGGRYDAAGWFSQIRKLHAMAAQPDALALDRVWRNVQRRTSKTTITSRNLGVSRIIQPQRRDWSRTVMPTRITVTAILLLVMAIPIGLGPARPLFEDDGALSTMPAFGPSTSTAMASSDGEESMMTSLGQPRSDEQSSFFGFQDILVRPGISPSGIVEVALWEVTLDPGYGFRFDPKLWDYSAVPGWIGAEAAAPNPYEDSQLEFLERGKEPSYAEDQRHPSSFSLDGVLNLGIERRTVYVLAPTLQSDRPPLVDGAAIREMPHPFDPGIPSRKLGSFELSASDAYQFLVPTREVNQVATGDTIFTGLPGTPQMAYVDKGPFGSGSPIPGPEVEIGQVINADETSELRATTTVSGLAFTSIPKSDNPTLNQTEKAIAPMSGQLFIEGVGQFAVEFDTITVEPGGWFNNSGAAAALYFLADGSLSLSVPEDQAVSTMPVGATIFQEPEKLFTFRNETDQPAQILMIIVYPYELPDWAISYSEGTASRSGVEVTSHFVEDSLLSLRGLHDVQFAVGSAKNTPSFLKSHFHEEGIALVAPWEGDIGVKVTGNGGVIMTPPSEVGQGIPSDSDTESIVGTGSYLWSPTASGFAVQGVDGTPLAWALLITPVDE